MEDYALKLNDKSIQLIADSKSITFNYILSESNLVMMHEDSEATLFFKGRKVKNELLPLAKDDFQWVAY